MPIRDEIIKILDETDPEGGALTVGAETIADFWGDQADAILSSLLINRIEAEAWDASAEEAFDCGWLHSSSLEDMKLRNPYRRESNV